MYDAPYYLAGDSRVRWHKQKANRAFARGAVSGATAGALLHPKTAEAASHLMADVVWMNAGGLGINVDPHVVASHGKHTGYGAAAYAVHQGVSGGVHTYKAKKYEKAYKARKGNTTHNLAFESTHRMSGTGNTGSAYYTRHVRGKTQRVRKGR